ncbi:MAG TPA: type III pantothenate kinase [Steroidobacteraceae bacterium]|nr:type III pantothenate kinase [Steroidobacteraceae bacterium]
MTLLVEAGHGGLKWAFLEGGRLTRIECVALHGVEPGTWQARLAALTPRPRRVVVANLAGAAFEANLRILAQDSWRLVPEFLQATAEHQGLRNGSADPAALAIDRWAAMVAAWQTARGALLVASAAAAFSVDLVDGDGLHRGGWTLPGERLMREALHAQTSGVAAAALLDEAVVEGPFGTNTAGGVQQGARLALGALVDRAATLLEAGGRPAPRVFVTGAAAEDIVPLAKRGTSVVPHLALEGLALLATAEAA